MKKYIAIILALAAFSAHAAKVPGMEPAPVACEGLKIATGPAGKGYDNLYTDIAAVCGQRTPTCNVRTDGGLVNANIVANKKADMFIAQADTVRDLATSNETIATFKGVMTLNYNYLHILTRRGGYSEAGEKKMFGLMAGDAKHYTIEKFSDLKGRNVALVGTAKMLGRMLTTKVFKGYDIHFVDVSDDATAIAKVKSGEVQAMFTVAGMPMPAVANLTDADALTLVAFDEEVPAPYSIRKLTYVNLAVYGRRALAVQNVLMTRDFSEEKAAQVNSVRQCIVDNLTKLKDGDFQPGWNEMTLTLPEGMPKFVPPTQTKRK